MTQKVDETVSLEPATESGTEKAKPSKAERLEARAAKLREAETAKRAAADEAPRRRVSGWIVGVAAVLVLALVATVVVLAVRLGRQSSKVDAANRKAATATAKANTLTADAVNRSSALAAAQKYAIDFGSYDYAKLDQDFQLVSSHLTPAFATKYKQISGQLRTVIVQYKGKSTATVEGAGVQSVGANSAVVLMFLDQTVNTTQSATPRIDRNRLKITLAHQPDGSWLISDLALV
jgi:hypothetical protein